MRCLRATLCVRYRGGDAHVTVLERWCDCRPNCHQPTYGTRPTLKSDDHSRRSTLIVQPSAPSRWRERSIPHLGAPGILVCLGKVPAIRMWKIPLRCPASPRRPAPSSGRNRVVHREVGRTSESQEVACRATLRSRSSWPFDCPNQYSANEYTLCKLMPRRLGALGQLRSSATAFKSERIVTAVPLSSVRVEAPRRRPSTKC